MILGRGKGTLFSLMDRDIRTLQNQINTIAVLLNFYGRGAAIKGEKSLKKAP